MKTCSIRKKELCIGVVGCVVSVTLLVCLAVFVLACVFSWWGSASQKQFVSNGLWWDIVDWKASGYEDSQEPFLDFRADTNFEDTGTVRFKSVTDAKNGYGLSPRAQALRLEELMLHEELTKKRESHNGLPVLSAALKRTGLPDCALLPFVRKVYPDPIRQKVNPGDGEIRDCIYRAIARYLGPHGWSDSLSPRYGSLDEDILRLWKAETNGLELVSSASDFVWIYYAAIGMVDKEIERTQLVHDIKRLAGKYLSSQTDPDAKALALAAIAEFCPEEQLETSMSRWKAFIANMASPEEKERASLWMLLAMTRRGNDKYTVEIANNTNQPEIAAIALLAAGQFDAAKGVLDSASKGLVSDLLKSLELGRVETAGAEAYKNASFKFGLVAGLGALWPREMNRLSVAVWPPITGYSPLDVLRKNYRTKFRIPRPDVYRELSGGPNLVGKDRYKVGSHASAKVYAPRIDLIVMYLTDHHPFWFFSSGL